MGLGVRARGRPTAMAAPVIGKQQSGSREAQPGIMCDQGMRAAIPGELTEVRIGEHISGLFKGGGKFAK